MIKKNNLKEQSPKKHSIITSVIKEMRALWLVEYCVISRKNHSREVNIVEVQKNLNGCLAFYSVTQKMINAVKENTILKSTKDANKFGLTLFKTNVGNFCWLNQINLLNSSGN